jgi:hypothetical protein
MVGGGANGGLQQRSCCVQQLPAQCTNSSCCTESFQYWVDTGRYTAVLLDTPAVLLIEGWAEGHATRHECGKELKHELQHLYY